MKIKRRQLIKSALFLGCALGSSSCSTLSANMIPSAKESYSSLESLKSDMPFATKWWQLKLRDVTFLICLEDPPYVEQSRQSVHVWRQRNGATLFTVWSFRTMGIGPIEVIIDEKKSAISVKALDHTFLKDEVIAFVRLAAMLG